MCFGGGGGWNPFDPVGSGLGLYNSGSGSPLPSSPVDSPLPSLTTATGVGFPDADTVINTLTGGATDAFGLTKDTSDLSQYIGYTNPLSPAEQGIGHIIKGGDVWEGLDRAVDLPGSRTVKRGGKDVPQGDVDRGARDIGKVANDASGGASGKVMDVVGPIAGALVASYFGTPAAAPLGAAAGSAFANKWNQRSYEDTAKRAALSAATTYVAQGAGDIIGSALTPTAGEAATAAASSGGIAADAAPILTDMAEQTAYNAAVKEALKAGGEGAIAGGISSAAGDVAPKLGFLGGLAKNISTQAIMTPIKAAANSVWPGTKPPNWTENSVAMALQPEQGTTDYSTELDPEMGGDTARTTYPSQATAGQMLKRIMSTGAESGGMGGFRMINRMRRA
jgi:hypothetical protein